MRLKAQMVFLGVDSVPSKEDPSKTYPTVSFIDPEKEKLTFFIMDKQVDEAKKLKELQQYKVKLRISSYKNNVRVFYEGVETA